MKIRYKLAELKVGVKDAGTSYIGQVVHNEVLEMSEMAERYAKKFGVTPTEALYSLSCVSDYIASEMAEGNRLNFDRFSVGLKMTGRFTRANESYSSAGHSLRVVMTPKRSLHAAARNLTPTCVTEGVNPQIKSVCHHLVSGEAMERLDVIRLDGGVTAMNVTGCKVDQTRTDEGVWLTTADGTSPLLRAQIRESTEETCDAVFPQADLLPGAYRIEIRSRGKDGNFLVSASRAVVVE